MPTLRCRPLPPTAAHCPTLPLTAAHCPSLPQFAPQSLEALEAYAEHSKAEAAHFKAEAKQSREDVQLLLGRVAALEAKSSQEKAVAQQRSDESQRRAVASKVFKFSLETRRSGFVAWKLAIELRKEERAQIAERVARATAHHARRRALVAWCDAAAAAAARARTARAQALITARRNAVRALQCWGAATRPAAVAARAAPLASLRGAARFWRASNAAFAKDAAKKMSYNLHYLNLLRGAAGIRRWRHATVRQKRVLKVWGGRGSLLGYAWRGWLAVRREVQAERLLESTTVHVMQRVDACIEVHLEEYGTGLRAEFTSQLEQRLMAKVDKAEMRAALQPILLRLSEIAATRISRSEVEEIRNNLHSFLFRDLGMAQEVCIYTRGTYSCACTTCTCKWACRLVKDDTCTLVRL